MDTLDITDRSKLEKLNAIASTKAYSAFLYDCDGTLADSMGPHTKSYLAVAEHFGVKMDPAIITELAGWPIFSVVEEIKKRYHASFDIAAFVAAKDKYYREQMVPALKPIGFVAEYLKQHAGKVHIAVVSGGDRDTVTATLKAVGLYSYVEYMVCAGETPEGKPSPQPFLKAAAYFGCPPSDCVIFEDGDAGVQSAIDGGIDWIRIDQITAD